MKNFTDEYTMDYRDPDQRDEVYVNPALTSKKIQKKITTKKSGRWKTHKLIATICLLLSVVAVIYEISKVNEKPVLLSEIDFPNDIRKYDDFIFPIVMQDPEPFNKLEEADITMLISSSLWRIAVLKKIDDFDEEGFAIVDVNDMWESYETLFGNDYRPLLQDNIETDFFKFSTVDNKFHIKPCSNQTSCIPYTNTCSVKDDKIILQVGYVSPNDKWRSLKPDRPEKPNPIKTLEYDLEKNEVGQVHVRAIKNY